MRGIVRIRVNTGTGRRGAVLPRRRLSRCPPEDMAASPRPQVPHPAPPNMTPHDGAPQWTGHGEHIRPGEQVKNNLTHNNVTSGETCPRPSSAYLERDTTGDPRPSLLPAGDSRSRSRSEHIAAAQGPFRSSAAAAAHRPAGTAHR